MATFSDEQKLQFASIIYLRDQNPYAINELTQQERKKLQNIYAQKIAYETVNQPALPPRPTENIPQTQQKSYGILQTICCCFYPESQRDNFDLTTPVFFKRLCGTFLFFKSDWLQIGDKPQLYGWLWFNITYILVLTMVSTISANLVTPSEPIEINTEFLWIAFGITALFSLACPFIYKAVVGCLGGYIDTMQSLMIYGYSIVLLIVFTTACIISSAFFQFLFLALAGLTKGIFIFRNYASKLDARSSVLLIVILILQGLYLLITYRIYFSGTPARGIKESFSHLHYIHFRNFES